MVIVIRSFGYNAKKPVVQCGTRLILKHGVTHPDPPVEEVRVVRFSRYSIESLAVDAHLAWL
jgi:hypothetical protein